MQKDARVSRGMLLCTDIDGTVIANGPAPEAEGALEAFVRLCASEHTTLVYVTGRHLGLTLEGISSHNIPLPDYIIADVGTTIYKAQDSEGWASWEDWEREIAPAWAGRTWDEITALLSSEASATGLDLQEAPKQGRYKVSYYTPAGLSTNAPGIMERHLALSGISASIVFSMEPDKSRGLLDVLPKGATKGHAVEFMMQKLGFPHSMTVFAGDSGNDMDVLSGPVQAVLVANATEEVRRLALELSAKRGQEENLYLACGGYRGMNGNYAAGIIEGVVHYIPEAEGWI